MSATIVNIITKAYNKSSVVGTVATSLGLYLCYVRYHRYKNINTIREKYPDPDAILKDPEAAAYINNHFAGKEFPTLYELALVVAIFKSLSIPSISKLIVGTGEFNTKKGMDKPLRRLEGTNLLIAEMTQTYGSVQNQLQKNPNTPETDIQTQNQRATVAIERLNELHGKYPIRNEDYLYTLSLIICEPIDWITRYEWRQPDRREINATFKVWYDIGKGMKIENIPETYEGIVKFKEEYAASHAKHHPANWRAGGSTVEVALSGFPAAVRRALYPLFMRLLPSMLDVCDVESFQLPYRENPVLTALLKTVFGIRATIIKYLLLPRSFFLTRNPFYPNEEGRYVPNFSNYKSSPYAEGYKIEEVGPLKFLPKAKHPPLTGGGKCPMLH